MKSIIFRADGNNKTGLGHLYRTFALIEFYKEEFSCTLITSYDSSVEVIPANYIYKILPIGVSLESEPEWLRQHFPPSRNILFTDGYQFTEIYQQKIKQHNYFLVCVDDFAIGKTYSNVVINHSPLINQGAYNAQPFTRFALGTKYAILRPEFVEAASRKRKAEGTDSVFICFGGADQNDLTLKAVRALLKINKFRSLQVVLGAAYQHNELFTISEKYPRVSVHKNVNANELVKIMETCNLAIVSSSNILYEVCSVKMPVLSGYYVDNQKNIYNGCLQEGCIYGMGNISNFSELDFENAIRETLGKTSHQSIMEVQTKLFDGNVKARYLDLLKPLLTFRKATKNDLMRLFEWSNETIVRANSYSSAPILLETHKVWFEKKLVDEKSLMLIALVDGEPAGMVRFDIGSDKSVVGILLAKEFRGRGLAPKILKGGAGVYFKKNTLPVYAYIKVKNQASVVSFEKAGYKKVGEELIHGFPSYTYKLELNAK